MQFHAPRSTQRRPVRSIEQPIDDVEVVRAHDVHDLTVETEATHIVDKMVVDEAVVYKMADEVVHPDVNVVDLVV